MYMFGAEMLSQASLLLTPFLALGSRLPSLVKI